MFRLSKRIAKFCLLLFLTAGVVYLLYIPNRHIRRYHSSLRYPSQSIVKEDQQQIRIDCRKDFFKSEGTNRVHTIITAPLSTLTLKPIDTGFDLIEHLSEMECLLYESDTNPEKERQIKRLVAHDGCYFYDAQRLVANDVQLQVFKLPSSSSFAQKQLLLDGYADEATFDLSKPIPTFTANNFKANIQASTS